MVTGLTFKILIHFELIFCECCKIEVQVHSFACGYPVTEQGCRLSYLARKFHELSSQAAWSHCLGSLVKRVQKLYSMVVVVIKIIH